MESLESSSNSENSEQRNFDQFMNQMQKQQAVQVPATQDYQMAPPSKQQKNMSVEQRMKINQMKRRQQQQQEEPSRVKKAKKFVSEESEYGLEEEYDDEYDEESEDYQPRQPAQKLKRDHRQDTFQGNANLDSANGAMPKEDLNSGRTFQKQQPMIKQKNNSSLYVQKPDAQEKKYTFDNDIAELDKDLNSSRPSAQREVAVEQNNRYNDKHQKKKSPKKQQAPQVEVDTMKPPEPVKILPPTSQQLVESQRRNKAIQEQHHKQQRKLRQQRMTQQEEDDLSEDFDEYYDEEDSSVFSDYHSNDESKYYANENQNTNAFHSSNKLQNVQPNLQAQPQQNDSRYSDMGFAQYAMKQKLNVEALNSMNQSNISYDVSGVYNIDNQKDDEDNKSDKQDSKEEPLRRPAKSIKQTYDTIKFAGVFLFLGSLLCSWAYYESSRYSSKVTQQVFFLFLVGRPIIVTLYCWGLAITQFKQTELISQKVDKAKKQVKNIEVANNSHAQQMAQSQMKHTQNFEDESSEQPPIPYVTDQNMSQYVVKQVNRVVIEEQTKQDTELQKLIDQKKYLPRSNELYGNFAILPLVAYGGFGRIVIISGDKKSFVIFCSFLECFLHTLPLGMLILYNNIELDKWENLDYITIVFLSANLVQILVEQFILHYTSSASIDLELKDKVKSSLRFSDITKAAILSAAFCTGCICAGLYAFDAQTCAASFYEDDYVCKACNIYSANNCITCSDASTCSECETGYYIDTDLNLCRSCPDTFTDSVTCTISEPLTCSSDNHFIFDNQCSLCSDMVAECSGTCDSNGCSACNPGFYVDGFFCTACDIPGCSDCSSSSNCILCDDDFLTVSGGACVCKSELDNQIQNTEQGYGCACDEGYYHDNEGCWDCATLIPSCTSCSTSLQSDGLYGFDTYEPATLESDPTVLICDSCPYSYYLDSDEEFGTYQCSPCTNRWDGCSYCEGDGTTCTKCFQSHVFSDADPDIPCYSCSYYINNCERCLSASDCTVCKSGYSKIGGACINTPW